MELYFTIFWIALTVVLLVAEALTAQMVTVWFAVGSFAALMSSVFSARLWLQALIFVAISVISLVLTRPLVKKHINTKKIPTNSDRVIGKIGIVKEKIDNTNAVGLVSVEGSVWSARSSDGTVIDSGNEVMVEKIEGVKLIVSLK